MCPPGVFSSLNDAACSRRNLFKIGAGVAAATAAATLGTNQAHAASTNTIHYGNLVDLTHVLGPGMPVFPGAPAFKIEVSVTHKTGGYYGNILTYWEHVGTHLDAPIHFGPDALFVDQIDPRNLIVPAVVIDMRTKVMSNPDVVVTPDDLLAWEKRYGRIPNNAAVLMSSDWGMRISSQDDYRNTDNSGTMHFPGFGKEAIDFLLQERSIAGIGVDTLSLDFGPSTTFAVHNTLLPANRWGIENLANLGAIPPSGATLFIGAPKVASGSGGPSRILAVW